MTEEIIKETVLEKLVNDIRKRQSTLRADRNVNTFYLQEVDPDVLIQLSYGALLLGLQRKGTLVDITATIGKRVRQLLKLKSDSVLEVHAGWFVVVTFIECGLINYSMRSVYKNSKKSKYQAYFLEVKDWKAIKHLWTIMDKEHIDLHPLKKPADDWVGPTNSNGVSLIKKGHSNAMKQLSVDNQPIVFNAVNKLQNFGWRVNRDVFSVYQQCMRLEVLPSPFKFMKEVDKQRQKSVRMEAEYIEQIALAYSNDVFYHMYNFDFRGRIYTNTAYLHEQSSDNSKGILMFDEGVALGDDGFYWLGVHTANCYGNDKISLNDRYEFVQSKLVEFIDFAKEPLKNTEWMNTDSPFCFLAACFELKKIMEWIVAGNQMNDFVSHIPLYIDGLA